MIYRGKNDALLHELKIYGKDIEDCYREIYGKHYPKLQAMERKLLVPQAFASSFKDLRRPKKSETPLISDIKNENLFMSFISNDAYAIEIEEDGTLLPSFETLDTSCSIIFNDEGAYKHAAMFNFDRRMPIHLISYTHEYNHFSFYALQEKPLGCIENLLWGFFKKIRQECSYSEKDGEFASEFPKVSEELNRNIINSALTLYLVDEAFAFAVEARILEMMEFDTPNFVNMFENSKLHNLFSTFYNSKKEDLIEYILNWHRVASKNEFLSNLLRSLYDIQIRKLDINTFVKREEEKIRQTG